MKKLRKPVYFVVGYYTTSMGSGRPEFHPKKPRPQPRVLHPGSGKGGNR